MTEAPAWQREIQAHTPKFGTTEPLIISEIGSIHSENGRPFLSAGHHPTHVIVRFASRRTSGGREEKKEEFASYTEIMRSFDDSLGFISYVRDMIYPYKYKTTPETILTVLNAIDGLPYWMVYRSDSPLENGKLPQYIMGAAKAIKGMVSPFAVLKGGVRDPLTKEPIPKPTKEELIHVEPFLEYVLRNHLLVNKDKACPAKEEDIVRVAEALFECPTKDKDRVGQMAAELGISDANKNRIRKFGNAFVLILDTGIMVDEFLVAPENFLELLSGKPMICDLLGQEDRPIELVTHTLGIINPALETMNKALKRKRPHPLTREDLVRLRPLIRI